MIDFNVIPLYNARVKFIAKICNSDDIKFCWTKTVGEFYKEIMFPNIFKKFFCASCNKNTFEHSNIVQLSLECLLLPNLSDVISESSNVCENCDQKADLLNIDINYLLCLDVENTVQITINLNEINPRIKFGEQAFILIGVIGFKESIGKEKLRHYTAYTRNFNGLWLKYDSTQISKRVSKLQKK